MYNQWRSRNALTSLKRAETGRPAAYRRDISSNWRRLEKYRASGSNRSAAEHRDAAAYERKRRRVRRRAVVDYVAASVLDGAEMCVVSSLVIASPRANNGRNQANRWGGVSKAIRPSQATGERQRPLRAWAECVT